MLRNTYRRLKFRDYRLSEKVRTSMQMALLAFDADQNSLFDEKQIVQALVTILSQNPNEVQYFIKNVFRYDKDGDGQITPEQFIHFCLEQHFGEMAIQRLHRKGYYSNGAKRIMNTEQFQNTLNYCLGLIKAKGTSDQYQSLFNDVDEDKDGFITYQEYFMFLRQYFGSERGPIDELVPKPEKKPEPVPQKPVEPDFTDGNGETPEERFAKLIYSQLKIQVMDRDRNKNLILEKIEIDDILMNVFKLSFSEQSEVERNVLNNSQTAKYEQFMRKMVAYYICQLDAKKNIFGNQINEQEFINNATRSTNFVSIKPAQHILKKCFNKADASKAGSISKNTYINVMRNIFESFSFDTRGLSKRGFTQPKYY